MKSFTVLSFVALLLTSKASAECWSKKLGWPCCSEGNVDIYYTDEDGDWGVENNDWCGMEKESNNKDVEEPSNIDQGSNKEGNHGGNGGNPFGGNGGNPFGGNGGNPFGGNGGNPFGGNGGNPFGGNGGNPFGGNGGNPFGGNGGNPFGGNGGNPFGGNGGNPFGGNGGNPFGGNGGNPFGGNGGNPFGGNGGNPFGGNGGNPFGGNGGNPFGGNGGNPFGGNGGNPFGGNGGNPFGGNQGNSGNNGGDSSNNNTPTTPDTPDTPTTPETPDTPTTPSTGGEVDCSGKTLKSNTNLNINGRKVIVKFPSGFSGNKAVPLLINYHPIGGSASQWEGGSQTARAALSDGAIVAFMDGAQGPMGQAWNVGPCCTDADDVQFTRNFIKEITSKACIDPKRIYAAGFSMGGGMSNYAGCQLADVIAAAAPSAFDLAKEIVDAGKCKPARPFPILNFRGTADNVVSYNGGLSQVVQGKPITFMGAKNNLKEWAKMNGCTGSPKQNTPGNNCEMYENCNGGVKVGLCTINGGGHSEGDGKMGWDFVKQFTLP